MRSPTKPWCARQLSNAQHHHRHHSSIPSGDWRRGGVGAYSHPALGNAAVSPSRQRMHGLVRIKASRAWRGKGRQRTIPQSSQSLECPVWPRSALHRFGLRLRPCDRAPRYQGPPYFWTAGGEFGWKTRWLARRSQSWILTRRASGLRGVIFHRGHVCLESRCGVW